MLSVERLPGALGCPVRVGRDGDDAEQEDDAQGPDHSGAVVKKNTIVNFLKKTLKHFLKGKHRDQVFSKVFVSSSSCNVSLYCDRFH